jgi:Flp pilus assembly protein TadD
MDMSHRNSVRTANRLAGKAVTSMMVLSMLLGASAFASGGGGGGGGGGGLPSITAPQFDAAAEYRKGVEALKANQFDDAEKSFAKVSQAAPKDANSWLLLGVAKSGKNDLPGAETAYKRAAALNPDNILTHRELGVVLAKQKKADDANNEIALLQKRADACGESCPDAKTLHDSIEIIQAALSGATPSSFVMPSVKSPEDGDRAYLTAVSLINEKRYDDALAALHDAQLVFGPHPDVLTYLGYTSRKLGHVEQAEAYYQQALALAPTHRGATEYYGELKVIKGDTKGAKVMLARLEANCTYGCIEAEDLRHWIEKPELFVQ